MAHSVAEREAPPLVFQVTGMTCVDSAAQFERRVRALPGVQRAELNYGTSRLSVWGEVAPHEIVREADQAGYQARPLGRPLSRRGKWRRSSRVWFALASGLFLGVGALFPLILEWAASVPSLAASAALVPPAAAKIFFGLAVIFGGYNPFRSAFYAVSQRRTEMNALMSVATIGAVIIGEWFEAAVIIFLFSLGEAVEARSLDRARRAIGDLLELSPGTAVVLREDGEVQVPSRDVRAGDVCLVRPGERVPVDGIVAEGESWVDESAITGESVPVEKKPGDVIFAGSANGEGALRIEATAPASESVLSRIVREVEAAQRDKGPVQRFVDRFARIYTPVVMIAALLAATVPPIVLGEPFGGWIYRGLALIVLSCPCALVISTPVAIVSALNNSARSGILVKGGARLETLARVDTIAFDKTGTLTHARFEVTDIVPWGRFNEVQVIAAAAGVEWDSEHPIARAVVRRAQEMEVERLYVHAFRAEKGLGAQGAAGGVTYRVGSVRYLSSKGLMLFALKNEIRRLEEEGKSVVAVARDLEPMGLIALEDAVRVESRRVVRRLRSMRGIKSVSMLTGDNKGTASALARLVGIDEVRAELLPDQKVSVIREWQKQGRRVAMVGDGINDGAALAQADVGVAMGNRRPGALVGAADVALLVDDLTKLPYAIALARRTLRVIRQNVVVAIGVKLAALVLLGLGELSLWMAIAGDVGASLLVTLNGIRLLRPVKARVKGRSKASGAGTASAAG